ncbi:LIMLP_03685 family anti-sigma factor [Leptospira yasudae]|uniref:LIMLP_03685 family anti-sigma factor n=1 Tax=Leptospira yasudae TaxID=2202201 RepID=UPI0010914256|nr:hypothetical protein [Leptospira yasudae]TGM96917.1 hypothetical protein EHR10_14195 [Leptospira yasudae]
MKEKSKQILLHLFSNSSDLEKHSKDLINDSEAQKEYFELMRVKTLLSSLDPNQFPIPPKSVISPWKKTGAFLLAAASLFFVFGIFLFYQMREDSYKIEVNMKASRGTCEQNAPSNSQIELATKNQSYCDLTLDGLGTFSLRLFPNTLTSIESKGKTLRISVHSGSLLFSSVHKPEGISVEVNSPHIRSVLLGTSLLVSAIPDKERILLIEGKIEVQSINTTETGKVIHMDAGSIAERTIDSSQNAPTTIQIGPLSAKEESVLRSQLDSLQKIRENKSLNEYEPKDLDSFQRIEESEQKSSRPYVQITTNDGKIKEGYLIEIGDHYTISTIDAGQIRIPRSAIVEMSTLRK